MQNNLNLVINIEMIKFTEKQFLKLTPEEMKKSEIHHQ